MRPSPCEQAESWISARIDGELAPDSIARLERHLEQCPDCYRTALEDAKASSTLAAVLAGDSTASRRQLERTILRDAAASRNGDSGAAVDLGRWARVAAAVLVAVVLGFAAAAMWPGFRDGGGSGPVETVADHAEAAPLEVHLETRRLGDEVIIAEDGTPLRQEVRRDKWIFVPRRSGTRPLGVGAEEVVPVADRGPVRWELERVRVGFEKLRTYPYR